MYGRLQWSIPPPPIRKQLEGEDDLSDYEQNEEDAQGNMMEGNPSLLMDESMMGEFLSPKEWGIIGDYRIPVLFRPRVSKRNTNAVIPAPMFLSVQTLVARPQVDTDVKFIDFGQMAVGKRSLKRILVTNNTDEFVELKSNPVNAVGPFFVMNAIRGIPAGEYRTVVIECFPQRPGLTVEVLELFSMAGGHQIRITLKCQGVEPIVELTGLSKALDSTWSPLGGILDFGNAVAGDILTNKFTICNKSGFPVDAVISRTACEGLAPLKQIAFMEKAVNGLPIFIIKPERVRIDPGENTDIEVIFRPDRGRNNPYREDLNVFVGQTDGPIKICVCGRAWKRQLFVAPTDPLDEPFSKGITAISDSAALVATSASSPVTVPTATIGTIDSALLIEDAYYTHLNPSIRLTQKEAHDDLSIALRPYPSITLEYPDLFSDAPTNPPYTEIEKIKDPKGDAKDPKNKLMYRQMVRKLSIGCVKVLDNRAKSTGNGTFEVILSPKAKESNLFSVNTEKGQVSPGGEIVIDVACALPQPKGIGGLKVGSWQSYAMDIILRGGWVMDAESEECKVTVILKAFVRL